MLRAPSVRPPMLMGRKVLYISGFRPINIWVRQKSDEGVEFRTKPQDASRTASPLYMADTAPPQTLYVWTNLALTHWQ